MYTMIHKNQENKQGIVKEPLITNSKKKGIY
jgi:hypothetical protein